MKRKRLLLFLFAGFMATLVLVWLFFPSGEPAEKGLPVTQEAPFLKTDPKWADSVLQTMSTSQKVAQLFIPRIQLDKVANADSFNLTQGDQVPAGILFSGDDVQKQIAITKAVIGKNGNHALLSQENNAFASGLNAKINQPEIIFSVGDTNLQSEYADGVVRRSPQFGIAFIHASDLLKSDSSGRKLNPQTGVKLLLKIIKQANEEQILYSAGKIYRTWDFEKDSLFGRDSVYQPLRILADSGLTVIQVDSSYLNWKQKNKTEPTLRDFCEDELDFKGLLSCEIPELINNEEQCLLQLLNEGADFFIVGTNYFSLLKSAEKIVNENKFSLQELDRKVHRMLLAKSWTRDKHYFTVDKIAGAQELKNPFAVSFNQRIADASVVLLNNKKNHLPLVMDVEKGPALIEVGSKKDEHFRKEGEHYTRFRSINRYDNLDAFEKSDFKVLKKAPSVILCLYNQPLSAKSEKLITQLSELQSSTRLIIVNCGKVENLNYLKVFPTLLHVPSDEPGFRLAAGRAVFGSSTVNGQLIKPVGGFKNESGIKLKAARLQFSNPEEAGFSRDSLVKIDYIFNEAIANRALPGGQVLFAKKGKIFYYKNYGAHTYKREVAVDYNHYYDMASITKVAATTIMAMHLYEKKKYKLDDSLYRYLPDSLSEYLYNESTIRNITYRQILIHASGLPAGQNIIRFLRFDPDVDFDQIGKGRLDLYFCDQKNSQYDVALGDSFYIDHDCLDTLWLDLNKIWLNPAKPYCYSDANMNLMYTMLRPMIGKQKWDRYLDSVFYRRLGMVHTTFNPILKGIKKEKIAPTEDDKYWRKQLVQGYVHDPTAALYGGVAGNAGLFSNAYDMAILFQMLLNKGSYGGINYFEPSTVELFTSRQSGTHRALGFNMQVSGSTYGCSPMASERTFGHTGFTGTAVWVDPVNEIIYVYISNRVYPDAENKKVITLGTTRRIHDVVYELLTNEGKMLQ